MAFIWLALWSAVVMVVTTVGISLIFRGFKRRFPNSEPLAFISGFVLWLVCLGVGLNFFPLPSVLLSFSTIFALLWLLLAGELKLTGAAREGLFFGICCAAVSVFPTPLPMMAPLPIWITYPLLGGSIYIIMRLFTIMDRVSGLSLITLCAQGLLILLMGQIGLLPTASLNGLFYIFVATISISQTAKVLTGRAILGSYAALIIGFLLGVLWTFVAAFDSPFVPILLFSYDAMEIVVAATATLVTNRRFYPFSHPFLIETAQATALAPKRLSRSMFFMLTILSLAAFLSMRVPNVFGSIVFLQVLVLIFMYQRLKNWTRPPVRFRDLKSDLKQGLAELKAQLTDLPLKKKSCPAPKRRARRK